MIFWILLGSALVVIIATRPKGRLGRYQPLAIWKSMVQSRSNLEDVPWLMVMAIIWEECVKAGGGPGTIGPTGDYGLMQITQPCLNDVNMKFGTNYTLQDMLHADDNIHVGCKYLHLLYNHYTKYTKHDWAKVVSGYNAGPGRVTTNPKYVSRVMNTWNSLGKLEWS